MSLCMFAMPVPRLGSSRRSLTL
uniref:Uncharacterized protein n=1 Tax=Arundo donax TaxID=35708 RepID=A0A0A8ZZ53_ARUDO